MQVTWNAFLLKKNPYLLLCFLKNAFVEYWLLSCINCSKTYTFDLEFKWKCFLKFTQALFIFWKNSSITSKIQNSCSWNFCNLIIEFFLLQQSFCLKIKLYNWNSTFWIFYIIVLFIKKHQYYLGSKYIILYFLNSILLTSLKCHKLQQ